jgi:hypothetical protein
MNISKPIGFLICASVATTVFFVRCTKNNPQPPKTDTIIAHDTTTDTLYATKPDPTVNLAKGLLLYLPFNGSIADSSGNSNPTQAIGGTVLGSDGHGYANSAFTANGGGQAVLVTNNGSIKFDTAYSVSIDFMTLDLSSRHNYIAMVDYATGFGPTFAMGTVVPANTSLFDVGVNDTTIECSDWGTGNPTNVNDTTTFVPQLSRWYNAIITYHRDSLKIYINGSLIGSKVGIGHLANLCPSSSVVIGSWWQSDPSNVNGAIDNVRMYNRVLTPHEIAALASNYSPTSNSVKATPKTAH